MVCPFCFQQQVTSNLMRFFVFCFNSFFYFNVGILASLQRNLTDFNSGKSQFTSHETLEQGRFKVHYSVDGHGPRGMRLKRTAHGQHIQYYADEHMEKSAPTSKLQNDLLIVDGHLEKNDFAYTNFFNGRGATKLSQRAKSYEGDSTILISRGRLWKSDDDCEQDNRHKRSLEAFLDGASATFSNGSLMNGVDLTKIQYSRAEGLHPEPKKQMSAEERLYDVLYPCVETIASSKSLKCLHDILIHARNDAEMVAVAVEKICAGHFTSNNEFYGLTAVGMVSQDSHPCLSNLLMNSSVTHDIISHILIDSHFVEDPHLQLVNTVRHMAENHGSNSIRHYASLALGSLSQVVSEKEPELAEKLLSWLEKQLHSCPKHGEQTDDEVELHTRVHLAAIGNAGNCASIEKVIGHLQDHRKQVRLIAYGAMRHMNCSIAEHHYLEHLKNGTASHQEKANVVDQLRVRHMKMGLKGETIAAIREHAMAEIGFGNDLDIAIHNFFEQNTNIAEEDETFWNGLQKLREDRRASKDRLKRALTARDFLKPLLDITAGVDDGWEKKIGNSWVGAEMKFTLRNLLQLYVSLFDGNMEIDVFNEGIIKAKAFGGDIDILHGKIAFRARLAYKSLIPTDLLDTVWDSINNLAASASSVISKVVGAVFKFLNLMRSYVRPLQGLLDTPLVELAAPVGRFFVMADRALEVASRAETFIEKGVELLQETKAFKVIVKATNELVTIGNFVKTSLGKIRELNDFIREKGLKARDLIETNLNRANDFLRNFVEKYKLKTITAVRESVTYATNLANRTITAVASSQKLTSFLSNVVSFLNGVTTFIDQLQFYSGKILSIDMIFIELNGLVTDVQQSIEAFVSRAFQKATSRPEARALFESLVRAVKLLDAAMAKAEPVFENAIGVVDSVERFSLQVTDTATQRINSFFTSMDGVVQSVLDSDVVVNALAKYEGILDTATTAVQTIDMKVDEISGLVRNVIQNFTTGIDGLIDKAGDVLLGALTKNKVASTFQDLVGKARDKLLFMVQKLTAKANDVIISKVKPVVEEMIQKIERFLLTGVHNVTEVVLTNLENLKDWATNGTKFGVILRSSRDLIDAAAMFAKTIPDIGPLATKVADVVLLTNRILLDDGGFNIVTDTVNGLADKANEIITTLPGKYLNEGLALTTGWIKEQEDKFTNLINNAAESLDVTRIASSLLAQLKERSKEAVRSVIEPIYSILDRYTLRIKEFVASVGAIIPQLRAQTGFLTDTRSLADKFLTMTGVKDQYNSYRQTFQSALDEARSTVKQFHGQFRVTRAATQRLLKDHLANIELYLDLECVPGAVCITDILVQDLKEMASGMSILQPLIEPAKAFLSGTLSQLSSATTAMQTQLEPLRTIQPQLAQLKDASQFIAGIIDKFEVSSLLSKLELLQDVTDVVETNIAVWEPRINDIVGDTGILQRIKSFSDRMFGVLDFCEKLDQVLPTDSEIDTFVRGLNLTTLLTKFLEGPVGGVLKQVTTQVQNARQLLTQLKKVSGADVLGQAGDQIRLITTLPDKLIDKINVYLARLQWQSRTLDPSELEDYTTLQHCSETLCLNKKKRSSDAYRDWVLPLKYPHFQTLSRDLTVIPGLYEDWQAQGVTILNDDENGKDIDGIFLISMFGTGLNADKNPLVVAMNQKTDEVLRIFEINTGLEKHYSYRLGIGRAKDYVYLFGVEKAHKSSESIVLFSLKKSLFDLSSPEPLTINITARYAPDAAGYGVFYESAANLLWLADSYDNSKTGTAKLPVPSSHVKGKYGGAAIGIKLDSSGKIRSLTPTKALVIGPYVQDMIMKVVGSHTYVGLLACGDKIGFPCRVDFRVIPQASSPFKLGTAPFINLLTKDPSRSVRVPNGASGLAYTNSQDDSLIVTFASASQGHQPKALLSLNDVEDSTWYFKYPVMEANLKIKEAITDNEVFLRLLGRDVISPREVIPTGNTTEVTATRANKRRPAPKVKAKAVQKVDSTDQDLLDFAEPEEENTEFDDIANTGEGYSGCLSGGGPLLSPRTKIIWEFRQIYLIVPLLPIEFRMELSASYGMDFAGALCMADRSVKAAIIPYVFAEFRAEAGVFLLIARGGIALTATIFNTRFIPEITMKLTPSNALQLCLKTTLEVIPISLRLSAYYQLLLCPALKCASGWLSWVCIPWIDWCDREDITIWHLPGTVLSSVVLDTCGAAPDTTPPIYNTGGSVKADQVGVNDISCSWNGFKDDESSVVEYSLTVGTSAGADDIVGDTDMATATSFTLEGVQMPHNKQVFVTVNARNDENLKTSQTARAFVADTTPPQIVLRDGNTSFPQDFDYQWSRNTVQAVLSVTEDVSRLVATTWAIGTIPNGTDLQEFTDVGYSTSLQNNNLDLQHNHRYYVSAYALNDKTIETWVSTDGFLVDTTNPVCGQIVDDSFDITKDKDYVVSTINFKTAWSGFSDPESPISHYEWSIVDASGARQFSLRNINLRLNAFTDGLNLLLGGTYRTEIRVWNKAGLFTDCYSDGFLVDYTSPVCTEVIDIEDGVLEDIDYSSTLKVMGANWDCYDPESGVIMQEAGIGSFQGGSDIVPMQMFSEQTGEVNASFTSYTISAGSPHFVISRAWNRAGLRRTVVSDGILVDKTAPHLADIYLYDNLPLQYSQFDQDFQTTLQAASPSWQYAFLDSESPVRRYDVSLVSRNGTVVDTIDLNGDTTSTLLTNLQLENGGIYTVSINCSNAAGLVQSASTDGFMVDVTPPEIGKVFDSQVLREDLAYWDFATSMFGNYPLCLATHTSDAWPPKTAVKTPDISTCLNDTWYDWESGLSHVETAVFAEDGTMVIPWQFARVDFEVTGRSGILTQGQKYYYAVRAHNRAGLTAESRSDGVLIDETPPQLKNIVQKIAETNEDLTVTSRDTFNISVSYESQDNESGITESEWSLGTYPGGFDVVPVTKSQQNDGKYTVQLGPLFDGQRYFLTVKARNGARRRVAITSNGFVVDKSPPHTGLVLDGWSDIDSVYQSINTTLWANWRWTGDDVGLASRQVGVGTGNMNADYAPFSNVDLSTVRSSVSPNGGFPNGVRLHFLVKETDLAGSETVSASNGVVVDSSPPTCPGQVRPGLQGQLTWARYTHYYTANWDACFDDDTDIQQYFVGLSNSSDNLYDAVIPYQSAASADQVIVRNVALEEGKDYYVVLKAVNRAGVGAVIISNAFAADSTPPNCTSISDGGVVDITWTSSQPVLSVHFQCMDPGSGIHRQEWAVGTVPGAQDVQAFTVIPSSANQASDASINMLEGQRYYSTVRVTNGVGTRTTISSDGIAFDQSPPQFTYVNDGSDHLADMQFSSSATELQAAWMVNDPHSGLMSVKIGIGKQPDLDDVVAFTDVSSVTSTTLSGSFEHGVKYYVTISATNQAGLENRASSNGVTVDLTAPTCTFVNDGNVLGQDRVYQTSQSSLAVNWECADAESGLHTIQRVDPTGRLIELPVTGSTSLFSGFRLAADTTHFVNLTLTNKAGLSATKSTNGVIIDLSPPTFLLSRFTFDPTSKSVDGEWQAEDTGSGLKEFVLSIGTTHGGSDILPLTNVALSTSYSTSSASPAVAIPENSQVFVTLFAYDNIGLRSLSSARVVTDTSPPVLNGDLTVSVVYPEITSDTATANVSLDVAWFGLTDPETGIAAMDWLLKEAGSPTGTGFQRLCDCAPAPNKAQLDNVLVTNNRTYVIVLRLTNGAGLQSDVESSPFTALFGPFSAGVVLDGPNVNDSQQQKFIRSYWCSWSGYTDPTHGIVSYTAQLFEAATPEVMISKKTYESDHQNAFFNGLSLEQGKSYFCRVCATNAIDRQVCAQSNGAIIDSTPPDISSVNFNLPQRYITSQDEVWVEWDASDLESGISHATVALGVCCHVTNLLPFTFVAEGTQQFDIPQHLLRENTSPIVATVRIYNKVGLFTERCSSTSLTIDETPPTAGTVQLSKTQDGFTLHWFGFTDASSGIENFHWALGTTPGDNSIKDWFNAEQATSAATPKLPIAHGESVYATVIATDKASLRTEAYSTGIVFDTTSPERGVVIDGPGPEDLDYQTESSISASWSEFREDVSTIVEYQWCIGTSAGQCNTMAYTSTGLERTASTVIPSSAVAVKYYVSVKAVNCFGLESVQTSDGVVVDKTEPAVATVRIGDLSSKAHKKFIGSDELQISWDNFVDADSSIKSYEWALCYAKDSRCIRDFTNVGLVTSVVTPNVQLPTGECLVAKVRATNNAGLSVIGISSSTTFDFSEPEDGVVSANSAYQSDKSRVSAWWTPFKDTDSGILSYEWCIGSLVTTCDILHWTDAGGDLSATATGLTLEDGKSYFIAVRATNQAGLTSEVQSSPFVVDSTPPTCGAIRDGSERVDVSYKSGSEGYVGSWDACEDDVSSIVGYRWALGTLPGLTDIQNWVFTTSASVDARIAYRDDGTAVYLTVMAENGAGLTQMIKSDGVIIDNSPPSTPQVSFGTPSSPWSKHQQAVSDIPLFWSSSDEHSDGLVFDLSLCYYAADDVEVCTVSDLRVIGMDSFTVSLADALTGVCYFAKITARNSAGLASPGTSSCLVLDDTPPEGGVFSNANSGTTFSSVKKVSARWSQFFDQQSEISLVEWCVGSSEMAIDDAMACREISKLSTTQSFESDSLQEGGTYYTTVRATNKAGLTRTRVSPGLTLDFSAPRGGIVRDGRSQYDLQFSGTTSSLSCAWALFADNVSSIDHYQVAFGNLPGQTDIAPWQSTGTATEVTVPAVLQIGQTTYCSVRAFNRAGLHAEKSTDGVLSDNSPPTEGTVQISSSSGFQNDADLIAAEWSGFSDGESGISHYEWRICQVSGSACATSFTSVHQLQKATTQSAGLTDGLTYVVQVKAVNNAGLSTIVTSMSTITVDESSPDVGPVFDGSQRGVDVQYQTNTTHLSASWEGFHDFGSPLTEFRVCAHQSPNLNESLVCYRLSPAMTAFTIPLQLESGSTYAVEVEATNAAGSSESAFTDGVLVDVSPPKSGNVSDGLLVTMDIDFQYNTAGIGATWSGFSDDESGIADFAWSAGTSPEAGDIFPLTSVGMATEALSTGYALSNGMNVFITVVATNGAGLTTKSTSDGFMIDRTHPLAGKVLDGLSSDARDDLDYQWSTSFIQATWSGFVDAESGIAEYQFALMEETFDENVDDWLDRSVVVEFNSVGLLTSLNVSVTLIAGRRYTVVVRAINGAGLDIAAESDGFVVDREPIEVAVDTWTGGNVYGSSFIGDRTQIGATINLQKNTTIRSSTQFPWVFTDPRAEFFLSVPSVLVEDNSSITNTLSNQESFTLTGYYATQNQSLGVYDDIPSPCCSETRQFAESSHMEMSFQTTEKLVDFASSAAVSPSGHLAIVSSELIFIVHVDQPSNPVFSYQSMPGENYKVSVSAGLVVFSAQSKVIIVNATMKAVTLDISALALSSVLATTISPDNIVYVLGSSASNAIQLISLDKTGRVLSRVSVDASFGSLLLPMYALTASDSYIVITDGMQVLSFTTNQGVLNMQSGTVLTSDTIQSIQLIQLGSSHQCIVRHTDPASSSNSKVVIFTLEADGSSSSAAECTATDAIPSGDAMAWQVRDDAGGLLAVSTSNSMLLVFDIEISAGSVSCSRFGAVSMSAGQQNSATAPLSLSFNYQLLTVSTSDNKLYITPFCHQNYSRQATTEPSSLPSMCQKCPSGTISSGGALDNCWFCDDVTGCVQPDQERINIMAPVAAPGLTEDNLFLLEVNARTPSGKIASARSRTFTVDSTPPVAGKVSDGSGSQDVDFYGSLSFPFEVTYNGFSDLESDINNYMWCVGTKPGMCDLIDLITSVNGSGQAECNGCNIQPFTMYYTTVVATNWAGLKVNQSSDGFLVDLSPPDVLYVNDGYDAPDQERLVFTDAVPINWNASDAESGIANYLISLGTTPGGSDIVKAARGGVRFQYILPNVNLQVGVRYFVTVIAINNAGLMTNVSSNGFEVGGSLVDVPKDVDMPTVLYFDNAELSASVDPNRTVDPNDKFPANREETIGAMRMYPSTAGDTVQMRSERLFPSGGGAQAVGRKRRATVPRLEQQGTIQYVAPDSNPPEVRGQVISCVYSHTGTYYPLFCQCSSSPNLNANGDFLVLYNGRG